MDQLPDTGRRSDLVKYRLETAEQEIKSADILLQAEDYKGANNRAFYAVFHAISAVHAMRGKAYRRHKDAIGNFNKDYVRTEIFSRDIGHRIAQVQEIRHASDYDDFYIAVKEEAVEQIQTARDAYSDESEGCWRLAFIGRIWQSGA